MTEEQQKAIDACKDQAAKEAGYNSKKYVWPSADIWYRAMQLYGEQCRKEAQEVSHHLIQKAQADGYDAGYSLGCTHGYENGQKDMRIGIQKY